MSEEELNIYKRAFERSISHSLDLEDAIREVCDIKTIEKIVLALEHIKKE